MRVGGVGVSVVADVQDVTTYLYRRGSFNNSVNANLILCVSEVSKLSLET